MQPNFNPAVNTALNNIRQSLANQQRVTFVYHCWQPFFNISLEGFRFKQIPEKEIPRLSLIPIVNMQHTLNGSRFSSHHNRHVPVAVPYSFPIEASIADLTMKFSSFGLVHLSPLETTIDNIEDSVKIFEVVTRGLSFKTPLEVLPEYFEVDSPVEYQFTGERKLLPNTASEFVQAALEQEELTFIEAEKAQDVIRILGESARIAHVVALDPNNGVLPKTIKAISDKQKFKFDVVDEWLTRQFPSFDARGNLGETKKDASTDLLAQLVALLEARTAPEKPSNPVNSIPVEAFEDTAAELKQAFSESLEEEEEQVICAGVSKNGKACPRKAIEGTSFCHFHGGRK